MTDPRIDGFNGWACKQKIYQVKMVVKNYLKNKAVLIQRRTRMVTGKKATAVKRLPNE